MYAEHIINENKRPKTGEIIVTLFEQCTLNCVFCNQNHESTIGIETIENKIDQVIQSIKELQKYRNKTNFNVNIMGGELFSDLVSDDVFLKYKNLVKKIQDYSIQNSLIIDITFATNFVWTKTDRVFDFINSAKIQLSTSYDPSGRFTPSTFEVFKKNVHLFKDHISTVNTILTKPNIDRFLNNNIPFFDFLYENFDTFFDHYTPEGNVNLLTPTDAELKKMALYMVKNFPESFPYRNYVHKFRVEMSCMDTLTIVPTGEFGKCPMLLKGSLPNKKMPLPYQLLSKSEMEQKWFDDYNCLSCEYLQRCSMGCFLSHHIKANRTQNECWLREVYEQIDKGNCTLSDEEKVS